MASFVAGSETMAWQIASLGWHLHQAWPALMVGWERASNVREKWWLGDNLKWRLVLIAVCNRVWGQLSVPCARYGGSLESLNFVYVTQDCPKQIRGAGMIFILVCNALRSYRWPQPSHPGSHCFGHTPITASRKLYSQFHFKMQTRSLY